MSAQALFSGFRAIGTRGAGAPLLLVMMLAMMVVPLPPLALDLLFTFNIALSLIILLVVIYVMRPLEFATFPTILLIATLLRLALNVASTRVVLLEGHTGGDAAGKVIASFGEFVIGGNYAVGLVVFSILVLINFVVVTKGAGRISEVSARFTLDALPGKQMAIDADLNSGLISQDEARTRRSEVAQEADFYGAMDGASKFVRGDAVAGIIILFINLIGGLAIGMLQHDLALADAVRNYSLLTIGDGLVAQIPSLVLSTAAAIIITRVSSAQDMGDQMAAQLFDNPRPLIVTGGLLGLLGMIPGMPNLAFLTLATAFGGAGWMLDQRRRRSARQAASESVREPVLPEARELSWDDVPPVDVIGLEVGYALIPLVDKDQGGQLMARIKGVRKKLSQELGFLVPAVHIRDNLELPPNGYRISLLGVPTGEAEVFPGLELAINPGTVYGAVEGRQTKDPAFGLDAWWIQPGGRDHAQTLGYTVVDANTVVATHLSQILQDNAHQLLGHEEVQQLLDVLAQSTPKLVENLVPEALPLAVLVKVLQNLLRENVPIRDTRTIAETLAEHAPKSQDPGVLTAAVRASLGRLIVQHISGMTPELPVITLDPALEQLLHQSIRSDNGDGFAFEPGMADRLIRSVHGIAQQQEAKGEPAVLLVSPAIRAGMSRWLRHSISQAHVLSYNEIPDTKQIKIIATVGGEQTQSND